MSFRIELRYAVSASEYFARRSHVENEILLADAARRDGRWQASTPRPGQLSAARCPGCDLEMRAIETPATPKDSTLHIMAIPMQCAVLHPKRCALFRTHLDTPCFRLTEGLEACRRVVARKSRWLIQLSNDWSCTRSGPGFGSKARPFRFIGKMLGKRCVIGADAR